MSCSTGTALGAPLASVGSRPSSRPGSARSRPGTGQSGSCSSDPANADSPRPIDDEAMVAYAEAEAAAAASEALEARMLAEQVDDVGLANAALTAAGGGGAAEGGGVGVGIGDVEPDMRTAPPKRRDPGRGTADLHEVLRFQQQASAVHEGEGEDGSEEDEEEAPRRSGKCVTCLGFLLGNICVLGLVGTVLGMLAYDGFTTNEIDYWFPVRLCPATDHAGVATFTQLTNHLATPPALSCRAATASAVCADEGNGNCDRLLADGSSCAQQTASQQACFECCAGEVVFSYDACQLPFNFQGAHHDSCISSSQNVSDQHLHWCPTALDGLGMPLDGVGGQCVDTCRQASFVSAPAEICGELGCAAAGTEANPLSIEIRRGGWGGDAGFLIGAEYHLVLLLTDDVAQMHANVTLRTSAGRLLYRGAFDRHACRNSSAASVERRRRLSSRTPPPPGAGSGPGAGSADVSAAAAATPDQPLPRSRRGRSLLARRQTWWTTLTGQTPDGERVREGDGARWAGRRPVDAGDEVLCADEVVPAETLVALQGDCNAESYPAHRTAGALLRAELGAPFALEASDFPLFLTVLGTELAFRGTNADGLQVPYAPAMFFTFYTPLLDTTARWTMWLGPPLGFLTLVCCCCCCLCCCCRQVANRAEESADRKRRMIAIQKAELTPSKHLEQLRVAAAHCRIDPSASYQAQPSPSPSPQPLSTTPSGSGPEASPLAASSTRDGDHDADEEDARDLGT